MQAIIEDRKRKPRLRLLNDADASVPSEGPVSEILYYHTDHLGSVRVITLSDGTVWKRSDHLPFGEIAFESVDTTSPRSQALNGYGYTHPKASYTGQEKDLNTGLYYYGARFYDAEVGRFIQADVLKNLAGPQAMNSYSYVNNNPILRIDPTGHWSEDSDFANSIRYGFIGAAIGAIGGAIGGFIYSYQHHHYGEQMWRDIGYGAGIGAGAGFAAGAIAGGDWSTNRSNIGSIFNYDIRPIKYSPTYEEALEHFDPYQQVDVIQKYIFARPINVTVYERTTLGNTEYEFDFITSRPNLWLHRAEKLVITALELPPKNWTGG